MLKDRRVDVIIVVIFVIAASVAFTGCSHKSTSTPKSGMQSTKPGLPKLIGFHSESCIPCGLMEPVIEDFKKQYKGQVEVVVVDIHKDRKMAAQYAVRFTPTQVWLDASGKEIHRHQGFIPLEDIVAVFSEHGINLAKQNPTKPKG